MKDKLDINFENDEMIKKAQAIIDGVDASPEEKQGFTAMLKGLPRKMLTSCESVYGNPTVRGMLAMQGKAIETAALIKVSEKILKTGWAIVDEATKDMQDNKVVHYMLRTEIGRAATTVIICHLMLRLSIFLEEKMLSKGHEDRAKICRKVSALLTYISALQVNKLISLDKFIDIAFDYIERLCTSAGVNLDEIELATS